MLLRLMIQHILGDCVTLIYLYIYDKMPLRSLCANLPPLRHFDDLKQVFLMTDLPVLAVLQHNADLF